jgi:uncharacterized protein (TIGR00255 family)
MTGFGKGEARSGNIKVTVEIKTVNHKFFEASLKLPNGISVFEDRIKEILQRRIKRGKIYLNLSHEGAIVKNEKVVVNTKAARNYHRELLKLSKALGLADVRMRDIMALPGVLNFGAAEAGLAAFWPKIKHALDAALDNLVVDREKEGRATCRHLSECARKIEKLLSEIRSRAHLNIEEYRRRFADRVKDLAGGREIDRNRLAMEVAIFAKNSDISEEIERLKSHLANFSKTLSSGGEVGKKIDFIAQELHRETNTIGSKASDFKVSKNVIDIKGEIEKIREQAKNLE